MTTTEPAPLRHWLSAPLAGDVLRSLERLRHSDDVQYVAVMPDVHLSGDVCVGVAMATNERIYPAAVGSDIGCGMAAIRFECDSDVLRAEREAMLLLGALRQRVPCLKHPSRTARELPDELRTTPLSDSRLEKLKSREGQLQFATLGRGNHFVEFQADEHNVLWLMVHSGSRAMGQAITRHHVAAQPGTSARELVALDANAPAGQAYLHDVPWAIRYAEQSRLAMVEAVAGAMRDCFGVDCDRTSLIHANHNHVRRETHFARELWVHRKGALSAALDEPAVIPGSMGSASYHVAGRGNPDALWSSSHGAGRALARGDAMRAIDSRRLARELQHVWFDRRIASRLRDEAPSAYKDIRDVMQAQRGLTRIVRELRPILSYKGV